MRRLLGFATPVYATGVLIRQNSGNGFIKKIELLEYDSGDPPTAFTVWEAGVEDAEDDSLANHVVDFVLTFDERNYLANRVRITVNTEHAAGVWEEIDAVRLLSGGSPSGTSVAYWTLNTAAPVAADDWFAVDETTESITLNVLANDYDPDGDALEIISIGGDPDGTATISGDGKTLLYERDSWIGWDMFTYTASDGHGGTTTATVELTPEKRIGVSEFTVRKP